MNLDIEPTWLASRALDFLDNSEIINTLVQIEQSDYGEDTVFRSLIQRIRHAIQVEVNASQSTEFRADLFRLFGLPKFVIDTL